MPASLIIESSLVTQKRSIFFQVWHLAWNVYGTAVTKKHEIHFYSRHPNKILNVKQQTQTPFFLSREDGEKSSSRRKKHQFQSNALFASCNWRWNITRPEGSCFKKFVRNSYRNFQSFYASWIWVSVATANSKQVF